MMKTIVKNILILVLMLAWSNAEAMNQETKKPAQHVPALNLAPAHALQQDAAWDTVLKSLKKKQYPIVTLQEIFNAACATSATKARAVLETIRDYQFIERAYSKLEITWCGWLLDVFNHAVSHKQWKLIHLLITTYDYRESTLTELYPTVQSQLEKIQTRRNKKAIREHDEKNAKYLQAIQEAILQQCPSINDLEISKLSKEDTQ